MNDSNGTLKRAHAGAVILLCAAAYASGGPPQELTIQLLPGGNGKQLAETLRYLASVTDPAVQVVDVERPLADLVRERCGTATGELMSLFRSFNADVRGDVLKPGITLRLPACPRWHFDAEVTIQPGWTMSDVMVRYLGSEGPRAKEQVRAANDGLDAASVPANQRVRLPYVSSPVTFRLREEYRDRAEEVLRRFEELKDNGVGGIRVLKATIAAPVQVIEPFGAKPMSHERVRPRGDPDNLPAVALPPPPPPDLLPQSLRPAAGAQDAVEAELLKDERANVVVAAHSPTATRDLPEPFPSTAGSTSCPLAPERDDWPLDSGALIATLNANRAKRGSPPKVAVLAVVDTGIERAETGLEQTEDGYRVNEAGKGRFEFDYSDPELNGYRGRDDDLNSCIDDIVGINLVTRRDFPEAHPEYASGYHGIHVAGLSQGGFRSPQLRELARQRIHLRIFSVVEKVSVPNLQDGGIRTEFHVVRAALTTGLVFAAESAQIANYSFDAGETPDEAFEGVLRSTRTLLLVVAAGNSRTNLDDSPRYPMAYGGPRSPRAIVVAAHGPDGKVLADSNYGPHYVDLAAPGCGILSSTFNGDLLVLDGTSQAAPLVAFVAGLLYAEGLVAPQAIKRRILSTVDVDPGLEGKVASAGRLNAVKALSVYQDWVSIDDGRTVRGRIKSPSSLRICNRDVKIRERDQFVFGLAHGSGRRARVAQFNNAGGPQYEYCDEPPSGTLEVVTDEGTRTVDMGQVREIVPAFFLPRP